MLPRARGAPPRARAHVRGARRARAVRRLRGLWQHRARYSRRRRSAVSPAIVLDPGAQGSPTRSAPTTRRTRSCSTAGARAVSRRDRLGQGAPARRCHDVRADAVDDFSTVASPSSSKERRSAARCRSDEGASKDHAAGRVRIAHDRPHDTLASFVRLSVSSRAAALGALVVACSSSTSNTSSGGTPTATSTAAAVQGPADTHCAGKPVVVVDPAVCHVEADAGHDHDHDAGAEDAGAEPAGADYGQTLYGSEGEDDDCKYHVKWQSTAVSEGRRRHVRDRRDEQERQLARSLARSRTRRSS